MKELLPIDRLSPEIQGIIEHFAGVKKAPSNFVAASIFATVGGVAGKRIEVVDGGYHNYGQLYSCLIGSPGSAKSPAMDIVTQPVTDIDFENYTTYRQQMKEWKQVRKKDDTTPPPTLQKIACDDVTMEKLMGILSENDNGILMHCDELTDLTANLNRYSKGDNLPKFLKMWSNGSVQVDRKGDDPLMVPRPFLSVLSGTQPVNIGRIFGKHVGTGFFARWLFTLPNEKPVEKVQPVDYYFDYWNKYIRCLHDLPPMELRFSADALERLKTFDDLHEMTCDAFADGGNTELAEYSIKQCYTIRRLAGIIHLLSPETNIMKGSVSPIINDDEVASTEKVVQFHENCAAKVLQMMGEQQMSNLTDKQLLNLFNDRFHPTNISELARLIGRSQQYLSKVLLHQSTTKLEQHEQQEQNTKEEICCYLQDKCTRLVEVEGLPEEEDVESMLLSAGGEVKKVLDTLTMLNNMADVEQAKGSIYTSLFGLYAIK